MYISAKGLRRVDVLARMVNSLGVMQSREVQAVLLRKSEIKQVVQAVLPIWIGYLPLGMACGILSQKAGLSPVEILVMSLMVFAGSGQFIALSMICSGSAIFSIALTTFIVNLRHLLYSSTLVPFLQGTSRRFACVFTQAIVDETFAVNYSCFVAPKEHWTPHKACLLNYLALGCWAFSCTAGNLLGAVLPIDMALVSYTLTAMFIGLWSFHFSSVLYVGAGLLGGALSVALSTALDYKLNIVIATIVAATVGTAAKYMLENARPVRPLKRADVENNQTVPQPPGQQTAPIPSPAKLDASAAQTSATQPEQLNGASVQQSERKEEQA